MFRRRRCGWVCYAAALPELLLLFAGSVLSTPGAGAPAPGVVLGEPFDVTDVPALLVERLLARLGLPRSAAPA